MTKAQQTRLYFPAWHRAAAEHGWQMRKGRLVGTRVAHWQSPDLDGVYQRVWDAANAFGVCYHRSPVPDDFRHACHVVALGKDKPSKALNNSELDRILALFRMLASPSLSTVGEWHNPENQERDRLVWQIKKAAPFGYVDAICRDMFAPIYDPPFWEDLPTASLRSLASTLRERKSERSTRQPGAMVPEETSGPGLPSDSDPDGFGPHETPQANGEIPF